jgi:16S rRNA (uracil1498-N3)-methyltransferase
MRIMARPRFFVPDATPSGTPLALPEDEAHHALHVLRLREGAEVGVFDGRGHEWIARVVTAGKRTGVTVELAGAVEPVAEPPVQVTLAIGLLKGDQMDAVVRDATMLGVTAMVPISTEHVVVPARVRGAGAVERWQRVAVASAKQCGRAVVPTVEPIESVTSVLERKDAGARLMCVEPRQTRARAIAVDSRARPERALVLIGPEGGWSAAEIMIAEGTGATLVHLGPRTLRAETAPTVMLSALWTVWGWQL